MNEIQIIQQQLATEQLHFFEVANACAAALGKGSFTNGGDFATACADYFAFAAARLPAGSAGPAASKLAAARSDSPGSDGQRWIEFLRVFNDAAREHFRAVDALQTRNLLVTEWRAVSRIDADSIFAERASYGRVKATLPPGVALVAAPLPLQ